MKHSKKGFALLLAGLVAFGCAGCTSDAEQEGSVHSTVVADSGGNATAEPGATTTAVATDLSADGSTTASAAGETTAAGAESTTAGSAAATSAGTVRTDAAGTTAATGATTVTTRTTTTTTTTTTALITEATEPGEVVEVKTITLGSTISFEGSGIAARGSKVGITKGGTYRITGTLADGQIEINTTKKVVLQLAGMSVTNSAGPAINVMDAKRVTIDLLEGTVNSLADGGTHEDTDGAFFSNDTVVIQGGGTLNVTANYAHGIVSDDDIIVNGGKLNVTSVKSGLFANDCVEINGGTLFCNAGTNGVKCKGDIIITGGDSTLIGGTKEEKGAIISLGSFTLTGGTLYAIGNTFTVPGAASTQNVLVLSYANVQAANTLARITRSNENVLIISSPRDYTMVMYSSDGMYNGASYSVYTGGSVSGGSTVNYVTTGGIYAGGTKVGAYAADGRVSTFVIG